MSLSIVSGISADLRHALRLYRRRPGFAAAALLALTLGIGGCGLIVSLAEALLFRPLPYPEAGELVRLSQRNPSQGLSGMSSSPADFAALGRQARSFRLAAYHRASLTLAAGAPERLSAAQVSGGLFDLLGVRPALGSAVLPRHERAEEKGVVVLGHSLWQRRFGGDRGIVGRALQLDGRPYTVVGVMPPGFRFPAAAELWVPFGLDPRAAADRESHYLSLVGRLYPGVPLARAQREMDLLGARLAAGDPAGAGWSWEVEGLAARTAAPLRPALLVLLAGGGLLLAIACGNVANLLLAKAAGRDREVATRAALGAGAGRLVRQVLAESTALTLLGGLSGLGAAALGCRLLVRVTPDLGPRWQEVGVDVRVALLTLGLALASGLAAGLPPALRLARADLRAGLHGGGAGTSLGWRRNRALSLLGILQVALSFVLLTGAGLLVRSFWRLTHVDPGFAPAGVLTLRVDLPRSQYPEGFARAAFFARALDRLRALPGVLSAGAASTLPLSGSTNLSALAIPGRPASDHDFVPFTGVTPGYFETLRIGLAAGRFFTEGDRAVSPAAPHAILVSESLAERSFPGEDPVGKTVHLGKEGLPARIVGVAKDVRAQGLEETGGPAIYGLSEQAPGTSMSFCLRTGGDPLKLAAAARRAILDIDPRQPVDAVATLEQIVRDSVADHRLALLALATFAGLAVVLATVGIYGLLSHLVGQAIRELGIRAALGAGRRHLFGLVAAYAAGIAVPGLLAGATAAYAASRLLASQLYGVSRGDAVTYAGAAVLLGALAVLAALAPARRAARVAPAVALAED
jgi:putative ABC transport system permease protein